MISFTELRTVIYITATLTFFNIVFTIRGRLADSKEEQKEYEKKTLFKKITEVFKMVLLILLFSPFNEELYFEGLDQIMMFVLAIDQVLIISRLAKKEYVTEEGASFEKILETNLELFEFGNRLFMCLYLLNIGWWFRGPVEITNMRYPLLISSIIYTYHGIVDILKDNK
tara:strand:- start:53 stop:562 length:510 start_codon:yes stop_codon:yes gene_type:complete